LPGAVRLPFNPENAVGEVLGLPAQKGIDLAGSFICPFIKTTCIKRSTLLPGQAYPVCSIRTPRDGYVCVCPKRFYAVDFLRDVLDHCWPGDLPPKNPQIAPEVTMKGFGHVDFVIADVQPNGDVDRFLSVELQAIDITGSVMKAYAALLKSEDLARKPTYGLNWDNVYKRFVTQIIRKGYFHHHWGTKIVAVVQDVVYKYICERFEFMRSADVKSSTTNIIFMIYRYEPGSGTPPAQRLVLDKVEGTSHSNLQQAVLYKEAPSKSDFCVQIKRSLTRR
jgi:hypothetical protein